MEDECTVTISNERKTFADFVDQVISEIPMPKAIKNVSKMCTSEKDPVSVLQSRGLLNIDKTPIIEKCPTSEIDLTFYTEEAHLGELFKLFSSTHKFRNGKLVYSTVQEVAPHLSEEVDKFNKWWQSESSPAQIKDQKEGMNLPLDTQFAAKKKSLMEMLKDLEKEEILKRYDSTSSRRDQALQKNGTLDTFRSPDDKNNYECSLRDQRIKRYFESQKARKECQQLSKDEKKGNQCDSFVGKEMKVNQNPLGKKVYHAKWVHRSPKKSPSKSVRFTVEQELGKKEFSASSPRKSKKEHLFRKLPDQKCGRMPVLSPFKTNVPYDTNKEHLTSNKPRVEQQHGEECEEEWIERLNGLHCRHPYTVHDKDQKNSFLKTPDKEKFTCQETFSNKLGAIRIRSPTSKCSSPMGNFTVTNYGEGDKKLVSSDSNTSLCTVFYNCEGNYSVARMSSSTSSIDKREIHTNMSPRKNEKEKMRAIAEKHTLRRNTISCPDSDSFSLKISPKKCSGVNSKRCKFYSQQSTLSPPKTTLECYVQCYKRNKNDHRVMVTREVLKTPDSATIPEDDLQSMLILRKLVNPEALKEFRNKYSNALNEQYGDTNIASYAKEHFINQIHKFRGNNQESN